MVKKLKIKTGTIVETSKTVVINSKLGDNELSGSPSREERKREASKPLYLIRYE
jgi:hypothetical protein